MSPHTARAGALRASMSEAEVILWSRLKRLREQGYHFRRQAPFRGYFLDFVCYARRLVVEVDGGQHGGTGRWRTTRSVTASSLARGSPS